MALTEHVLVHGKGVLLQGVGKLTLKDKADILLSLQEKVHSQQKSRLGMRLGRSLGMGLGRSLGMRLGRSLGMRLGRSLEPGNEAGEEPGAWE